MVTRRFSAVVVRVFRALLLVASPAMAAPAPYALLHSLLDPGTNSQVGAQQGYSVALDGNVAVVAAPFDDLGGSDSGVVHVYDATTGARLYTLTNPSPALGDNFGGAVALSGNRIVVGSAGDDTGVNGVGSVYVFDLASASPATPVINLHNPHPILNDNFGAAVSISGSRLVVGVPYDDSSAGDSGRVYVYELFSATPTTPLFTLTNPSPAAGATFGRAVTIDGTRVVVGANFERTAFPAPGAAYVYDLAGMMPEVPAVTLQDPNPTPVDLFGSAVGISGTRVVVGSRWDDTGATNAGRAFVYDVANANPSMPVATLTNSHPAPNDLFGFAVAISGVRVAVGAVSDLYGNAGAGNVYVYDLSGGTPMLPVATLTQPVSAAGDAFGFSISMIGSRVLAGAPQNDSRGRDSGNAYLYNLSGGTPTMPVLTFNTSLPAADDLFGFSVAVAGRWVLVGTPFEDTGAPESGVAYVYDLESASPPTPFLTLTNPHPARSAYFGFSVAMSGTRAVIGVVEDVTAPNSAGGAYVYDLASPTPAVPSLKLVNPRPLQADYFGASVAISDRRIVIGVPDDSAAAFNSGRAYVYDLAGVNPAFAALTLTNPSPAAEDYFGHSVAISGTRIVVGAFGDDTGAINAGSAYVYDLGALSQTVPIRVLNNPTPGLNDGFGSAVAISGTRIVIGAYGDQTGGYYSGSAYVYDLAGMNPGVPTLTLTNPTPSAGDSFGNAVTISGTLAVIAASGDDAKGLDAGLAYLYDLAGPIPGQPIATLSHPMPSRGDQLGNAVAFDGATVVVGASLWNGSTSDRGAAFVFGATPVLHIARAAPGLATIWWTPSTSSGFVLQYKDSLSSPNWISVGDINPVTVPATNAARFYRLFQP